VGTIIGEPEVFVEHLFGDQRLLTQEWRRGARDLRALFFEAKLGAPHVKGTGDEKDRLGAVDTEEMSDLPGVLRSAARPIFHDDPIRRDAQI